MSPAGHPAERIGWKWPKSHPLCSAYGLWEDHAHVAAWSPLASRCWNSKHETPCYSFATGSVTMILVPLITIELQLLEDCERLGLTAIAGSQVNTWSFPTHYHKNWSLVLSIKVGFCCGVWENLCSTPSSHRLQCQVSFFKEGGSRLRRNSQITWAALSGQGRDPQPVALNQQEATNSLYRWEPGDFWQPWPCEMFFAKFWKVWHSLGRNAYRYAVCVDVAHFLTWLDCRSWTVSLAGNPSERITVRIPGSGLQQQQSPGVPSNWK